MQSSGRVLAGVVFALVMATMLPVPAQDRSDFEVWAIDQAGTGGTLYIYDGETLIDDASTSAQVVELSAVTALCQQQTGSAPVRAHMLAFNSTGSHGILAYVATGHVVVFIDAARRVPVACIDVGVQAHAAFPSPDDRTVIVANQNGKLLQRINADFHANRFTLEDTATINLATCTTPSGARCEDDGQTQTNVRPDNAPICPVIDSSGRLVFVTLRGGGLLVIDLTTTPMRIVAEYGRSTVRGNGCGGVESQRKMFINAGAGPLARRPSRRSTASSWPESRRQPVPTRPYRRSCFQSKAVRTTVTA